MAKKEVKTDLWVAGELDALGIPYTAQGSDIKEINEALSTASKHGTGKAGYPEYTAVVGDFVLVIEDKADMGKHTALTGGGVLSTGQKDIAEYAVNGAYHYAKHIATGSPFHKVFAVGVSGDEKRHRITPLFVDDREGYKELPDITSFVSFTADNIEEYYTRYVLGEKTDVEKTTEEILKDAAELHEYLRTYGSVKDQDKPLVVSGILLALDDKSFDIDGLKGSDEVTDGDLVCEAIQHRLRASNVGPDVKRDKLMSEFAIIRTSARLNRVDDRLGKTPLKFYTEFLKEKVFDSIKYKSTSEDFIGRFYGEFMSYSGGDGQSLGIILTPRHICDLFCFLLDLKEDDVVLDPCCGTGGFLVSAMHYMLAEAGEDANARKTIKKKQLHGYEIQSNMFAIAATNMILREDGNSNILCEDFLRKNPAQVQMKGATVGMMNPPYSQGTKADPSQYELSFTEHLLDSLTEGAKAAVIVPASSMTGKSNDEKNLKVSILQKHTLEGVITCNTDTFYRVGVKPVIAVFTAHDPHREDKECRFIDFRDDGYEVHAHIGLVETESAKDKRQHMIDTWNDPAGAPTRFCVTSTVKPEDEWLHSFYYFNDEIPTDADFEKVIGDYLAFEFTTIMHGRGHLKGISKDDKPCKEVKPLNEKEWAPFLISDLFALFEPGKGKGLNHLTKTDSPEAITYIGATNRNDGVLCYVVRDEGSEEMIQKENCIGFIKNGDGSAGYAIYREKEFISTSDVIYGYADWLNRYTGLFFVAAQDMIADKYSHGYKRNKEHLLSDRVMLPVDGSGSPDYEYMEEYAKSMMTRKYRDYLAYIEA